MPAQLLALTEGPHIVLDKPILLLGRHAECDIQIDSRKISRRHCVIAQVADYLVVRDLDSTNGIRVNGSRVVEGKLRPGDELTIGSHRYQVSWSDVPGAPPAEMRKELARPVAPDDVQDDDEVLESCDEPVPLAEPEPAARAAAPQVARPVQPPAAPPRPAPPARPLPTQESVILPDEFQLAPNSNPSGPVAPQAPGSSASH